MATNAESLEVEEPAAHPSKLRAYLEARAQAGTVTPLDGWLTPKQACEAIPNPDGKPISRGRLRALLLRGERRKGDPYELHGIKLGPSYSDQWWVHRDEIERWLKVRMTVGNPRGRKGQTKPVPPPATPIETPAEEGTPTKRGRGRPRGSKTRTAVATAEAIIDDAKAAGKRRRAPTQT